jgi:2-polyprenyl-6-methoxyphenol hydroxylase-like FAD-dependent oxidoreductase
LSARVLSAHFERVTLVERDPLPSAPEVRKGVPQGRHAHALLVRGRMILENLFPGLEDELCTSGAVLVNGGREFGWHHGGWRSKYDSSLVFLSMSRPLLEHKIANRVRELQNVTVQDQVRVEGLRRDGRGAVTGVRVRGGGGTNEIEADLVVDAMGRGSSTPRWLNELGFAAPQAELLPARVTYASGIFRRSDDWPDRRVVLITGAPTKRSGGIFPIEGGRWLVTLISFFDETSPEDHESFVAFARSLAAPDIHQAIQHSEPLSDIVQYHFAGSLRRHYERLDAFPEGLIVVGDGVCSFNPVYGQGMTVSAIEAECLDKLLTQAKREGGLAPDFAPRWFRRIQGAVDTAWNGVTLEDLLFPELADKRPASIRALQWYMAHVHRATHSRPAVTDQFYRVVNFLDPPSALFRPRVIAQSLLGL